MLFSFQKLLATNKQAVIFFLPDRQNPDLMSFDVQLIKTRNPFMGPNLNSQVASNGAGCSNNFRLRVGVPGVKLSCSPMAWRIKP
jgi:hypothetical protein